MKPPHAIGFDANLSYNPVYDDGAADTLTVCHKIAVAMQNEETNLILDMTHADEVIRDVEGGAVNTLQSRMVTGGNQVPLVVSSAGFMIGPSAKAGSIGAQMEESPTLDTKGTKGVAVGIDPYNTAQTGSVAATLGVNAGMPTGRNAVAIGFKPGQSGREDTGSLGAQPEQSPTLPRDPGGMGVGVAVGVDSYNQTISPEVMHTLHHHDGLDNQPKYLLCDIVRRLTPGECETLQGFPRDWTKIPYRGKPTDQCPDSPRYKALGNSWATNCAEWILRRIVAADRLGLIP